MTESTLIIYLNYSRIIFAAATILSLPFAILNVIKCMNDVPLGNANRRELCKFIKMKGVISLVISVALVYIVTQVVKSIVRAYVITFLVSLPVQYKIFVNGKLAQTPEKIVSTLKTIVPLKAHHSHPTKPIVITIQANHKSLKLELCRDSSVRQEYWIFVPNYKITSIDQIGTIETSIFDNY